MSELSQKMGVSFAVEGTAADDVVQLNTTIAGSFGSQVRFGQDGNSRPHVTVALGEVGQNALAHAIALVERSTRTAEPFLMTFGPVARESVTGRYVLADVYLPEPIRQWRSALHTRITDHLSGLGRTTDEPHLTVAVVEEHGTAVDELLARTDQRIAGCRVTHIDVAQAGPRGAKGTIIRRFTLRDA
ncbi:2'-5' RNA ligase family protein [Promicromonospora iranensis]|uniref:2'-5' RNA ligase family protein n=1 Tax=Promicromonospora iranensis TaxID=1105144 RepID=UPI0023AA0FD5|nr:2'-5' RNA ligase family protein [Promicromonospora iranensis]